MQLCYGHGPSTSTYSPVGTLDPVPSLEAPGPGLQVYPSEDFTSQVRSKDSLEGEFSLYTSYTTPEMNFWIWGAGSIQEHPSKVAQVSPGLPAVHINSEPMPPTGCTAWGNCLGSLCIGTRTKSSVHTVQEDVDPSSESHRGGEDQE